VRMLGMTGQLGLSYAQPQEDLMDLLATIVAVTMLACVVLVPLVRLVMWLKRVTDD
jgi:hypothetical protein